MKPSPDMRDPVQRAVFILTYPRSGSTIIQYLLNQDPTFLIRGENYATLAHLFRADRAAREAIARSKTPTQPDMPWFGRDQIDADGYANDLRDAFVHNVLRPSPEHAVIGFKEVRHAPPDLEYAEFPAYLDFLKALFPAAKFVFPTREKTAVAKSEFNALTRRRDMLAMVDTLDAAFHQAAAADPERCFVIDNARVVDGAPEIDALLRFVGANIPPEVVSDTLNRRLVHAKKDRRSRVVKLASRGVNKIRRSLGRG